jgi:dethiobiotin synthetase
MPAVFVTATGTDIGKTYVTAGLAQSLRRRRYSVSVFKPVCSGFDPTKAAASDPALLLQAIGQEASLAAIDAIAPWRFAAPLSPDMAAEREGRAIDFAALRSFCEKAAETAEDVALIEGIGGLMVPLTVQETVADLIAALSIPALLVTGTYVGSLSHTLTALEVMRVRGIMLAGLVVNETPGSAATLDETCATLRNFTPHTPMFGLRWDDAANSTQFGLVADCLLSR